MLAQSYATHVHEVNTTYFPPADFGVSAALEATPGHEGASQSQHQPGAQQAFDAAAHMRRVSIQQQANSKVRRVPDAGFDLRVQGECRGGCERPFL